MAGKLARQTRRAEQGSEFVAAPSLLDRLKVRPLRSWAGQLDPWKHAQLSDLQHLILLLVSSRPASFIARVALRHSAPTRMR
eukprot:1141634-Alexandrium_andersonii.AAC.1